MRDNRPSAGLYELLEEVGASNGVEETLSSLDRNLRRLLPFDAMSVYLLREDRLRPAYRSSAADAAGERPSTYKSSLSVPLDDGADLIGMLALYSAESGAFHPTDLGVLLWLREDLSHALKNAIRQDGSGCVAGFAGAGVLLGRLEEELARRGARDEGLTILICAVDGLSAVSQRWGEAAQTRLAQALANGLRRTRSARDLDGGSTPRRAFALGKLSGIDLEVARLSMAGYVESVGIALFGERLLALRLGAAQFPEEAATARELLALADSRLKKAEPAPEWFSEDLMRLAGSLEEAAAVTVESTTPCRK
jgi:GGDEF domain-containing protein